MNLDVQNLVDALAEKMRQPVGVDDRRYRAVAYSSHGNDVDAVRRASILRREAPAPVTSWLDTLGLTRATDYVRVPSRQELDMLSRVCFPLRFHDRLLGFLWLVDGEPHLTDEHLDVARTYVPELAESLFRLQQQSGDDLQREGSAVHALTAGADTVVPELAAASQYVVAVLRVKGSEKTGASKTVDARLLQGLVNARRLAAPRHQIAAVDDGSAIVVLAGSSSEEIEHRAQQVRDSAARELLDIGPIDLLAGVGDAVDRRDQIASSFRRAQLALRAARLLNVTDRPLLSTELGADGLIIGLLADHDAANLIPTPLQRLQAAPDGESLIATLWVYLEHAGHAPEAAAALFVHRSSLYHRIHRIEQITGLDLRSGDARLALHLGLRLLRLTGGLGHTGEHDKPVRLIS